MTENQTTKNTEVCNGILSFLQIPLETCDSISPSFYSFNLSFGHFKHLEGRRRETTTTGFKSTSQAPRGREGQAEMTEPEPSQNLAVGCVRRWPGLSPGFSISELSMTAGFFH